MPATRTPKQLRARATRDRLLVAAARMFAERGYEGTAVGDIAEAAGCSKGAYYFHFASKNAALLALIEDWRQVSARRIDEARRGRRAPQGGLRAMLDALLAIEGAGVPEPALLLEFWAQAERSARVRRQVAAVDALSRRALVRAFREAAGGGQGVEGRTVATADLALALHRGLVVGACLGLPSPRPAAAAGVLASFVVAPEPRRERIARDARREPA